MDLQHESNVIIGADGLDADCFLLRAAGFGEDEIALYRATDFALRSVSETFDLSCEGVMQLYSKMRARVHEGGEQCAD